MRKTVIIISLVLISVASNAQDIITMNKGNRINAIVREVTPTLVRYNLYSDPDGKVIFLYKDMVSSILYQNGRIERFVDTDTSESTQNQTVTEQPVRQSQERQPQTTAGNRQSNTFSENWNTVRNSLQNRGRGTSSTEKTLYFTPKVGINVASMSGLKDDEWGSWGSLISFHIGCAVEKVFTNTFSLESGLIYSRQGAKYTEEGYDEYYDEYYDDGSTLNADYLNIPILAKYYVSQGFNIFGGLQFGFNISTKENLNDGGSQNWDKYMKSPNASLVLGAGYLFDSGLSISANYNYGLMNELKKSKDLDEGVSMSNRVFQVSVGYRF